MREGLLTLLISVVSTSVQAQTLWPKNTNGNVTIPFYFDNYTIPIGDPRRDTFQKAVELYKKSTCIDWVQVARNETPGHVKVQGHASKCSSYTGRIVSGTNNISLSTRCNVVKTMLHEMAHALGMTHTHQRPDRDTYVEIWKDNINKDNIPANFDIKTKYKTQGLPYDYLSIMHYGNSYFSLNRLYTITPTNRLAMFGMGSKSQIDFRWSDAAWINRAYKCESFFLKNCSKLNCKNGGYVGKDCSCKCPENTEGKLCETITGDLFNMKLECGGIVKTENNISAQGVKECVYQIIAPRCQIPQIEVTRAVLKKKLCVYNKLISQVSKTHFGHVFCNTSDIPLGKGFISDSSEAVIYYTADYGAQHGSEFFASIKFVKNTTWPGVNAAPQTSAANNQAVTLEGPCVLVVNSSFIYSTPNFPSPVACYAECFAAFNSTQTSSLVIYEAKVEKKLNRGESLTLQDPYVSRKVTGNKPQTMQLLWPFNIILSGSDHPGNGFQVTLTPAEIVVHPCGEELKLSLTETKTITNPLMNTTKTTKSCIFKIEAEGDHRINCSVTNSGTLTLAINTNFPIELQFTQAFDQTYKSVGNNIHFYYWLDIHNTDWSITCKAVQQEEAPHHGEG